MHPPLGTRSTFTVTHTIWFISCIFMLQNSLYILLSLNFLFSNEISISTLELEGEYEERYTSTLNSVLGPENFYIEVNAIIKKEDIKNVSNEIPINFLPGLGIKTKSIPKEIKPNSKDPNALI